MAMKTAPVEAGHRIPIPEDWAAECGIEGTVTLEKVNGGILVRPKRATWDEFFADKWDVTKNTSNGPATDDDESLTITRDDLLY